MKCPNIYCLMHENGNCIFIDEHCVYKDKYELDHCPTEEEYNRTQSFPETIDDFPFFGIRCSDCSSNSQVELPETIDDLPF